jgi:hypothetical protein
MDVAYGATKAAETQSEYAVIIAFPVQEQRLGERHQC